MSTCPVNRVSPNLAPAVAAAFASVMLTLSFFWGLFEASGTL